MTHGRLAGLAVVLAVAAALRLWGLDRLSFWHDEGATYNYADNWPWRIWGRDTMPPLHYQLMSFWQLLGSSEWFLRLSSVVASLGAVALLWRCGLELRGPVLAALSALLLALSPFDLFYAQEYRMYALLELTVALALLGFLRLLRAPDGAARPLRLSALFRGPADTTLWGWRLYALGTLLALYTHNMGFFWPLTACLGVLLLWGRRPERRALAGNWLKVNLLILLLWMAYWPTLFDQLSFVVRALFLASPPFFGMLWESSAVAFGTLRIDPWLGAVMAALCLALLPLGVLALRRNGVGPFLLLALLLPPLAEWLISLYHPIFAPRTLIWIALPASLLLASGLLDLWRRRSAVLRSAALALLAGLVVLRGFALYAVATRDGRSDWRALLGEIAPQFRQGDLLAMAPFYETLAPGYYRLRHASMGEPWPQVAFVGLRRGAEEEAAERLRERLGAQGRVWVIVSTLLEHDAADPEAVLALAFDCRRALDQHSAYLLHATLHVVGPACEED